MIDLTSAAWGAIIGYVVCVYAIGRHIHSKVEDSINEHIAAATYLFINEKTKEATRINIELDQ